MCERVQECTTFCHLFIFFPVHFINGFAFCAQHAYEVKSLISLPPAVFKHFLLAVAVIAQDVH